VDVTTRDDQLGVAKEQLGDRLGRRVLASWEVIIHGCPPTRSGQYRPSRSPKPILDRGPAFFHYRRAMRLLGRAVLLLLAGALVVATLPPGFDEDRSEAGFCSPDCLLQQDAAHAVAVTPTSVRYDRSVDSTPERSDVTPVVSPLVQADALDTPRAPPHA
jgi:hypothetical protein